MFGYFKRINSKSKWSPRIHDITNIKSSILISKIILLKILLHFLFLSIMAPCSYTNSYFIRLRLNSLNRLNNIYKDTACFEMPLKI